MDYEQELYEALKSAFNRESLERMLRFRLGRDLGEISSAGDLRGVAFDLIRESDRHGWIGSLLRAAREENPGNRALAEFEENHPELLSEEPIEREEPTRPIFVRRLSKGGRAVSSDLREAVKDLERIVHGDKNLGLEGIREKCDSIQKSITELSIRLASIENQMEQRNDMNPLGPKATAVLLWILTALTFLSALQAAGVRFPWST